MTQTGCHIGPVCNGYHGNSPFVHLSGYDSVFYDGSPFLSIIKDNTRMLEIWQEGMLEGAS